MHVIRKRMGAGASARKETKESSYCMH